MKLVHAAAIALIDSDGRVLVTERPETASLMPGYWEFPGGKLEKDETPEDCVRREVREEIGVELECFAPLSFISENRPDEDEPHHVIVYVFLGREWQGIPQPREGQAMRWVRSNQLREVKLLPGNVPLIPLIRDRLDFN